MNEGRRVGALAFGGAGLVLTAALFFWLMQRGLSFEPDHLYHLSLLREMVAAHSFRLLTWGQLPFLGWDKFFADKEFLFHLYLYFPYQWAGDRGVEMAVALLPAALIWFPYFAFPRHRFLALALSAIVLLENPYSAFRLSLVRPHQMAVPLLLFAFWCALRGKRWGSAFGAFFYALAYHAFYLPLLGLACLEVPALLARLSPRFAQAFPRDPRLEKAAGALAAGLGVGLLVHPQFPANIVLGLQSLMISLRAASLTRIYGFHFGVELNPLPWSEFFFSYGSPLLAFLFASGFWWWGRKRVAQPALVLSAFLLTALFWGMSIQSPRGGEYAMPLTVLFFLFTVGLQDCRATWACVVALALLQFPEAVSFTQKQLSTRAPRLPPVSFMEQLLAPIPPHYSGVVFHDNWGLGPYVIYLRSGAKAVDVLDPSFLYLRDPRLAVLRQRLSDGLLADPVSILRKEFGAHWALVSRGPLGEQISRDPSAHLARSGGGMMLFQL